jgi:CheY-like chemotaxis protein
MIPPDTPRPLTPEADDTQRAGLRILVAEDDADTARTTAVLLEMDGHHVYLAGDGASALKAIEGVDPDVVLLDIDLPGMDGYEVARRLKARNLLKNPLLIAITGYGQDADKRYSAEAGIDLHWVKPVDPELLQRLLKRFERVVASP